MKHLPNLLTLANLFSGCIAIAFILNAQPFISSFNNAEYWVVGTEQMYWGAYFILFAAFFDLIDGPVARALKVTSPIGAQLDSLADLVSFGVAPSMILFKMLWATYMSQPEALDAPMLAMTPAFIVACAGALRLARFNVNHQASKNSFTGMPIPAAGIFIAILPLLNWYNPYGWGVYLQNKWTIYAVIAVLSWLMVSRIRFIKLIPAKLSAKDLWPQLLILIAGIAGWFVVHIAIVPIVFVLYIVLSFIHKPSEEKIS